MTKKKKRDKPHNHSEFLKDNDYGTTLKDADIRQEAYRQFCAHIASGYPKHSFFFNHPRYHVCWKTMERYIEENPDEFPIYLLEEAKSKRHAVWFQKGIDLVEGKIRGGSPNTWATIMRNIFRPEGWDRDQSVENARSHIIRLADAIRSEEAERE